MNKSRENLPKSVIKGSGFINTDLEFRDSGDTIMFLSPQCVVIGFEGLPHTLFSTPDFDSVQIPDILQEKIYQVRKIILKKTFSDEALKEGIFFDIPNWLIGFDALECIDFDGVNLDHLSILKNLSIKHLILHNTSFSSKEKIKATFSSFKKLTKIDCDQSFYAHFGNDLKTLNLNITLIAPEG
ncbi:hypothetical protein [Pedobacter sp. UBA5917]|jgi:hypothetical protein|uniref:hypothetical protein n=1 Tax=Pedobacter sp. UBA5917 TaxID=1947061 RepID=UPI0025E3E855|nr:hypothetical protein [Pedobacter sp. UBA5917]